VGAGIKNFRVAPELLGGPKTYEVDPLEYLILRMSFAAAPGLTNEMPYLVQKVSGLLADDELPAEFKERFLAGVAEICRGTDESARLNAFYLLRRLTDGPATGTIRSLRADGTWDRLATEYDDFAATLPAPPADPLQRAALNFQRDVPDPYLPPSLEPFRRGSSLIGPAEKARNDRVEELNTQAEEAENRGDHAAAVEHWRAALALRPDEDAEYALARGLSLAGQFDEAITRLDRLRREHPRTAIYHSACATALQGAGRSDEALAALDSALAIEPSRHLALLNKALILLELDRIDEATTAAHTALTNPSWVRTTEADLSKAVLRLLALCGQYAFEHGRPEVADVLYGELCDLAPTEIFPWLARVAVAAGSGPPGRTDELIAAACAAVADPVGAWNAFAEVFAGHNDPHKVIRCLDQALALAPRHAPALRRRGELAVLLKRNDEAVTFLERYLSECPEDGDVWNDLGCALQRLGQESRAIDCYAKAVEHRPDDPIHWTNLAGARLQDARPGSDADEIYRCITTALRLDPGNVPALSILSVFFLKVDQPDAARSCAEEVLRSEPGNDNARAVLYTLTVGARS
jgi:tetratricopeptide (TPR) repeat protein